MRMNSSFSRAKYLLTAVLFVATGHSVSAQTPKLQFEVASVKQAAAFNGTTTTSNGPGRGQTIRLTTSAVTGGPGSPTPDRYSYRGATFRNLLIRAYGLVDRDQQVSGPGWIDSEHYDVAVTMPASTTEPMFRQMLQNLLAERFKLVVHLDSKLLPVYELTIGKNGQKLKESAPPPTSDAPSVPAGPPQKDKDGFSIMPAGYHGMSMNTGPGPSGQITQNWFYGQYTMAEFAGSLKTDAGRHILDKTGLTAKYDIKLYFDPNRATTEPPDHPVLTVFDALEAQLGLKLVDAKAPFDVVVMDSAEKVPTEN